MFIGNCRYFFSNFPVPCDAYAFVRKMDELIEELVTENVDQKFITQGSLFLIY
jgi:hypothetical protein